MCTFENFYIKKNIYIYIIYHVYVIHICICMLYIVHVKNTHVDQNRAHAQTNGCSKLSASSTTFVNTYHESIHSVQEPC